jgi:hypothetical protein
MYFSARRLLLSWTSERARVASLTRSRTPDGLDLLTARLNLKAARIEDYVAKVVNAAPLLTLEQRARIASLIQPAGRG